ncbi:hypothetical protein DID73_00080 [Candidatus Marinamargulisbacteria bacterium SCGC AG-343-K17]|nr:hypothetical protein DID73_00080 [Candidatus Marinamargulisbacteria bacterium SCGC AG-343-K17]
MLCLFQFSAFSVTGNINVQFLLGDNANGTFEGTYNITFGVYPSPNMEVSEALWKETHQLIITQGKVSQILGTKTPLEYHLFKSDKLYIGLSFQELTDRVFVPLISVPAAVVSKYSVYAREIEYTAEWMKVNTQNQQVGIGITQNLTVPFQVVGSANITSVNATGELHSPDGYNVHQLDYLKLVNLDDYSLSPFDFPSRTENNAPTKDVVFVTTAGDVGVGIYVTADIVEQLHVSGNLKVDNGTFLGKSSMQLAGNAGNVLTDKDGRQLIWDSNKSVFRAGYSSGDKWHLNNNGQYSAAFGSDNKVSGDYGFSAGQDNEVLDTHSIIGAGKSNSIAHKFSGILSGEANMINVTNDPTNGGYMVIAGGKNNVLTGDYGFIGGGNANQIKSNSKYASIVGGKSNILNGLSDNSVILGGETNQIWGTYSVAMGKNAQIGADGSPHHGVFMFADSTVQSASPFKSYYSDQFLVHATNGLIVGLSDFNHKDDLVITDFNPAKTYPPNSSDPNLDVKDFTIRTAGDIVAADSTGKLGYLVGDGTYITNISSLWQSQGSIIFANTQRIGVGFNFTGNEAAYPSDTILHLKENSFAPNVRIESLGGGLLDIGVDKTSNDGLIDFNNQLKFKRSGTDIFEITNNDELYFKTNLGIKVSNADDALDVDGTAQITGKLQVDGGIDVTQGSSDADKTVTAGFFVGDGFGVTDAQVTYMVPGSSSPKKGQKHVYLSDDGYLGIGKVAVDHAANSNTNTIDALLHVGDNATTQLKLQQTGDAHSRFVTLSSTSQFDITFNKYQLDDDKVFSINSKKDGSSLQSLVMVSARGHVGILKDPTNSDALAVQGRVDATEFKGNGALVTGVQLDTAQDNGVLFKKKMTFKEVVQLQPHAFSDPPACTMDDVGAIYAQSASGGGSIAICACIGAGTRINMTGTDNAACPN